MFLLPIFATRHDMCCNFLHSFILFSKINSDKDYPEYTKYSKNRHQAIGLPKREVYDECFSEKKWQTIEMPSFGTFLFKEIIYPDGALSHEHTNQYRMRKISKPKRNQQTNPCGGHTRAYRAYFFSCDSLQSEKQYEE